jgi:RNA polymerase I-specific transcription initiation factor RRN3
MIAAATTDALAIATVSPSLSHASYPGQPETPSQQSDVHAHQEPLHIEDRAAASSFLDAPADPRFVLPKCELPPRKDFEPVETFVSKAVQEQHQQKDARVVLKNYKGIIEALRFKSDIPLLTKILLAIRTSRNAIHCLTSVSNKHARLIHQIVRFDPFYLPPNTKAIAAGDYNLVDAHFTLLVALVSANSVFLVPAVTALWKMIARYEENVQPERTQRLHAAVATILRLCPKGKMEIFAVMAASAPYRNKPEPELSWFYQQCVYVLEYVPGIEGHVLEMLVDKCLEMDVEIKIKDGGEVIIDQEDDDDMTGDVFQLDLDDDDNKPKPKPKLDSTVDEMADKLDSLMLLIMEYVERRINSNLFNAYNLYYVLSRAFESSILITHKSKFVQFLLLHLCGLENKAVQMQQQDEEPLLLYRDFAAKLIDVIVDPYRATITRQGAACYLASFVSRTSYVCPETICEAVSALLRWAEAYMQSQGSYSVHAADVRNQCSLHLLFYTVSQAAFYIMSFRGTEAVLFYRQADSYEEPERIDISSGRWTRLCRHPLQPLRYCLESVRSEFLTVSKTFELLQNEVLEQLILDDQRLATALGKKKRASKIRTSVTLEKERQTGGVGGLGRGTNPLDSFFPFDPYLLHRSNQLVKPFYSHWKGSLSPDDMMDGEEEDGEDIEEQTACSTTDLVNDGSDSSESNEQDMRHTDDLPHFEPMSLGSHGTASTSSLPANTPDGFATKRGALHESWATLKRSRAPSIENGSW